MWRGWEIRSFGHLCNWYGSLARQPVSASDNIRQACHQVIDYTLSTCKHWQFCIPPLQSSEILIAKTCCSSQALEVLILARFPSASNIHVSTVRDNWFCSLCHRLGQFQKFQRKIGKWFSLAVSPGKSGWTGQIHQYFAWHGSAVCRGDRKRWCIHVGENGIHHYGKKPQTCWTPLISFVPKWTQ